MLKIDADRLLKFADSVEDGYCEVRPRRPVELGRPPVGYSMVAMGRSAHVVFNSLARLISSESRESRRGSSKR